MGLLMSHAGYRVSYVVCGEEIIHEREVVRNGVVLCQACAGGAYYRLASAAPAVFELSRA